ncbi:uncharacterized protein LOC126859169 isoform X2 [Cataglyphis hispanica]|uniref:uncharacterized protein LOC126859169 isoform X2 n=1 Tax=Cataglyphis hispanica TaxID=1086592 RepID=UPI00217FA404|nr:uncharacterized protein LOC126859169 isoform X2 [Cataglyphis hispanica]
MTPIERVSAVIYTDGFRPDGKTVERTVLELSHILTKEYRPVRLFEGKSGVPLRLLWTRRRVCEKEMSVTPDRTYDGNTRSVSFLKPRLFFLAGFVWLLITPTRKDGHIRGRHGWYVTLVCNHRCCTSQ